MAKKHKTGGAMGRAQSELENMKHRDLKRACIVRGLPFDSVIAYTIPALSNWFIAHYGNGQNPILLDEYDEFIKGKLIERGYKPDDPLFHPDLRLGYYGQTNPETGEPIIKRPKGIKKAGKKKRDRDETTGLFSGTKKSLTYDCQKKGMSYEDTLKAVLEKFKDAVPKSVKIWFNRSKKIKVNG